MAELTARAAGRARYPGPVDLLSVALAPTPTDESGCGFDAFYRAEFGKVIGFLMALGSDVHAAKDIAQDAFVQAHPRWSTIDYPGRWVRVAASHMYWRRTRRAEVPYGLTGPERPPGQPPPRPGIRQQDRGRPGHAGDGTPEEQVLAGDRYRRALDALSPTQRDVVVLALAGFTNAEIADVLNRSLTAVETHKHRGFKRLQTAMRLDEREGAS